MRKIIYSFLAVSLMQLPLCATIFEDLDPHALIKCQFSSIYQNRIVIDGHKIKKVILSSEGLSVNLEEESGQVFVYALSYQPETTTLSLVTDIGIVQDIELSFIEKSSEILVLEPKKKPQVEATKMKQGVFSSDEEEIVKNVKAILKGKSPDGYHSCEFQKSKKFRLGAFVSLEPSGKFVRGGDSIYVWKVKNESKRPLKLSEKFLNFCDSKWVYLDQEILKPKGTTFVLLSGV